MPRGRPSRTTVYARLHRALADLSTCYGGLPSPSESQSVWSDIWHLEAHHSTALEGNTLVLREVEALLERGRAVGAKPLSEYMEVKGYGDAAQWVYAQAQSARQNDVPLMSVQEVRRVHHEVMAPVWAVAPHAGATAEESPGSFRRHDIRAFDGGMTPPTWPLVPAEITAWVEAANDTAASLTTPPAATSEPMPEVLARIHTDFEKIHPFLDGNGRTGRLLLNLVLVRLGFPPVIILKRQRPAYLAALEVADRGEHGPLGELFARAMLDNVNRFVLPNVAGPARLVPLPSLADTRISLTALRAAARRGRLQAQTDSQGEWLSSRRAVEDYLDSRQHHGRRRAEG